MRDWITEKEATELFEVTPRTIRRWQEKHEIRVARFHKRLPLLLNRDDLIAADKASMRANSALRQ